MTINRYLRLWTAVDRDCRRTHSRRRGGGHPGGRHRVDEHGADGGQQDRVNPWLIDHYADSYLTMGLTAERVAKHYGITREEADEFSYRQPQKALAAVEKFKEEIVPVTVTNSTATKNPAKPETHSVEFSVDEGPRADTSREALAKLKPAFHAQGPGHGRELVADLRWCGGLHRHVR